MAPRGDSRDEGGAYVQDQIFLSPHFRWVVGTRFDLFDVLDRAVMSPRTALLVKPRPNQTIRFSFNRAFRAPSFINSFLETGFLTEVDLGAGGAVHVPDRRHRKPQPQGGRRHRLRSGLHRRIRTDDAGRGGLCEQDQEHDHVHAGGGVHARQSRPLHLHELRCRQGSWPRALARHAPDAGPDGLCELFVAGRSGTDRIQRLGAQPASVPSRQCRRRVLARPLLWQPLGQLRRQRLLAGLGPEIRRSHGLPTRRWTAGSGFARRTER